MCRVTVITGFLKEHVLYKLFVEPLCHFLCVVLSSLAHLMWVLGCDDCQHLFTGLCWSPCISSWLQKWLAGYFGCITFYLSTSDMTSCLCWLSFWQNEVKFNFIYVIHIPGHDFSVPVIPEGKIHQNVLALLKIVS